MRDASSGWRTSHQRRSWQSVMRARPLRPSPDGGCACALAFSTLLSSQGADAHRPRPSGSYPGQPYKLTRTHGRCQATSWNLARFVTRCASSIPSPHRPVTGKGLLGRGLALSLETAARERIASPGQDERLAAKRIKSNRVSGVARRGPPAGAAAPACRSVPPAQHAGYLGPTRLLSRPSAPRRRRRCACRGAGPGTGRAAGRPRTVSRPARPPSRCSGKRRPRRSPAGRRTCCP